MYNKYSSFKLQNIKYVWIIMFSNQFYSLKQNNMTIIVYFVKLSSLKYNLKTFFVDQSFKSLFSKVLFSSFKYQYVKNFLLIKIRSSSLKQENMKMYIWSNYQLLRRISS